MNRFLSNWVVRTLLCGAAAVAVLLLFVSLALNIATRHNRELSVPDFTNMTWFEALGEASLSGVKVQVSDSVYVRKARPGVVLSQSPAPGEHVKKGRRIFLTVNAVTPMKVTMPDVRKTTLRQAKSELAAASLSLARLEYIGDISSNRVLEQLYRGRPVRPGTRLNAGSPITLRVSTNGSEQAWMPDVKGRKYLNAVDLVQENYLNPVHLRFDASVRNYADSLSSVVYAQDPGPSEGPFPLGMEVTLYLSPDAGKRTGR
ncbi:MAG: PASTA domain-containing protein [Bacteroidales bacterium]|nr:PASTA domain-containing protein [Bacteroidales bacterium]